MLTSDTSFRNLQEHKADFTDNVVVDKVLLIAKRVDKQ